MNQAEREQIWMLIEQQAMVLAHLAQEAHGGPPQPAPHLHKHLLPRTQAAHAIGIASYVGELARNMQEDIDKAKI